MKQDTIAAIATPLGTGGIGIIRVSGSAVVDIAQQVLGGCLKPRVASLMDFKDAQGVAIDQGIALFFPGPNSFTGEDVLELQAHGGPVVCQLILSTVLAAGARLAEAGEFSLRAFLNDKLDLLQAEAISGLIQAGSEQAARAAKSSLQGDFSRQVEAIRADLLSLRVYVEASIDFTDEDIDFIHSGAVQSRLEAIQEQLLLVLKNAQQGALLRSGASLAIIGEPNVGKSSLLNALTRQETAIVTSHAGTTRDILRESICIDGIQFNLIDTAGIRQSDDVIEQEGIRRAWQAVATADCLLFVTDASQHPVCKDAPLWQSVLAQKGEQQAMITLANKSDICQQVTPEGYDVVVSAKSGHGITELEQSLKAAVGWQAQADSPMLARQRHIDALKTVEQICKRAHAMLTQQKAIECLAADLALAADTLATLTGQTTADDLLGEIFSSFCVGK